MAERDPVTGQFLPRDWEAWSRENASDYRTTKHTRQCNRCSRWCVPTAFHQRQAYCYQCRAASDEQFNRRRKAQRNRNRRQREAYKRRKQKKNE